MTQRVTGSVDGVVMAGSSADSVNGSELLSLSNSLHGSIKLGEETQTVTIAIEQDGYIAGEVESGPSPITLELLGADGEPIRQISKYVAGMTRFYLVAPYDNPVLRMTAPRDVRTDYQFILRYLVPVADQVAPKVTYQSPSISRQADLIATGGTSDEFWAGVARNGAPLIEPLDHQNVFMTFLARGLKRNGQIFGAPSSDREFLEQLGQSDIWFKSFIVPNTTRLSYKIACDVPEFDGDEQARRLALLATLQADPLNPDVWPVNAPDAYNQKSVIELPDAPKQPGMQGTNAPAGSIDSFAFESATLGNHRDITLYRPHGFDPDSPENVLLVLFDAKEYRDEVPTPKILDNLIADGVLPPVSVAFIANPDNAARGHELPANPVFADVVAGDLMPLIGKKLGVDLPASRTVIAGSSYGGLASVTIALRHPDVFGSVVSMSGSFWWSPKDTPADQNEYVSHQVAITDAKPVRMFLTAGLFETGWMGVAGILESNRHLRDVFLAKGYDVTYREYAGGHDYLVWRGALADGLIHLFGR